MDRWTGVLKVSLSGSGAGRFFKVAASVLLSDSKSLAVPSLNAIFFRGDRVEGTGDPSIERLSNSNNLANLLLSKFRENTVNAWVVEASNYNGAFAVYDEMIPTVNSRGEPNFYDPNGFPGSSSIVSIISACVNQIQDKLSIKISEKSVPPVSSPKTVILGFSKGGTVLNQLVTEISSLTTLSTNNSVLTSQNIIFPTSTEAFLNTISEFHYVDVGLNSSGAYLTDEKIIRNVGKYLVENEKCIIFFIHGTPRQWRDPYRIWIGEEKDLMVHLIREEDRRSGGRLKVFERFYFGDGTPSLRMHFEIIDAVNLN